MRCTEKSRKVKECREESALFRHDLQQSLALLSVKHRHHNMLNDDDLLRRGVIYESAGSGGRYYTQYIASECPDVYKSSCCPAPALRRLPRGNIIKAVSMMLFSSGAIAVGFLGLGPVTAASLSAKWRNISDVRALQAEYDFVIIGGGTAGLTVADRLTVDGKTTALVIEHGEIGGLLSIA